MPATNESTSYVGYPATNEITSEQALQNIVYPSMEHHQQQHAATGYSPGMHEAFMMKWKVPLGLIMIIFVEVAHHLNVLQNMLETGAVNPADFAVPVTNDEEMASINAWLERLSQNVAQDPMMLDSMYSIPYVPPSDPYADLLEQQPSQAVDDPYVHSHPIFQEGGHAITGQRDHYMPQQDILMMDHQGFQPTIHTTTNLMNANVKSNASFSDKNKHKAPIDGGRRDKSETTETFQAIKNSKTSSEDRKNLTTLANVFNEKGNNTSSPRSFPPYKEETKKRDLDKGQQQQKETNPSTQRKPVNKDVMDILASDLSDLTIKNKEQLYPNVSQDTRKQHKALLNLIRQQINVAYNHSRKENNGNKPPTTTTIIHRT